MGLSILQALPSYFGSKRRLLGQIFRHIPPPSQSPHFIDSFSGGASVSLFAKAKGYEVQANDVAIRSYVVGKALIENSKTTLSREDVLRLFAPNENAKLFVQKKFPHVFIKKHCEFLDLALNNIRDIEGTKRYLLYLLILKFMLRARPMGNFGARLIIEQIQVCDWEQMNKNFVSKSYIESVNIHPLRLVESIRKNINKGIFSNGKENKVFQMDVFDFLLQVEGDCIYFDPPYMNVSSYESSLKVIDSILEGQEKLLRKSIFSGKYGLDAVEKMLSLAIHIPYWVLSFGNQGGTELEVLIKLMKKYKRFVTGKSVKYVHCRGLSSIEHQQKNREYIVVGHD